jgi:pimeloyl-ACP methyl ester carboxylesterase
VALALAALALIVPAAANAAEETGTPPETGAPAASTETGAPGTAAAPGSAIGPGQRPQLLLFHGGSFLYEDPFFEPLTRPRAIAAGFVPHYVHYPLGDLPAAVTKAREEARRLREKFGLDRVYAYGASAGGTLAALLSGDDLVAAAVAKAPVSNLVTWTWPLGEYGLEYWNTVQATPLERERLSPTLRQQLAPLLIYQGRADMVVPPAMSEEFAEVYKRVHLWLVPGGHTTERRRPYLITRAMHWLEHTANLQARAANAAAAAPESSTP